MNRYMRLKNPLKTLTIVFIFIGITLRFINLNWDGGTGIIHSDERLITDAALKIRYFSQLNPGFQDYNGLPVYTLKAAADLSALITGNPDYSISVSEITLIGRFISAFLSGLTIVIIYLLGKNFSLKTGLTAAVLAAYSPLSIQLGHFHTADTYLTFFFSLLILLFIKIPRKMNFLKIFYFALISGLALGTKNTAFLILPLPVTLILMSSGSARDKIISLILFSVLTIFVFFAVSPYSFLEFQDYLTTYRYLARMVSGNEIYGWTLQFKNTGPLLVLSNIVFAYGLTLAIAGYIGLFDLIRINLKKRTISIISVSIWALFFTVFLSFSFVKFIRYVLPLMPILSLAAALLLSKLSASFLGRIIGYFVVLTTILYGLSFASIYQTSNPYVSASSYIYGNIPPGSILCVERNNTTLPLPVNGNFPNQYIHTDFDFYEPDSISKTANMFHWLDACQFLFVSSRRIYKTVQNMPDTFPVTVRFYELLLTGKAGFTKITEHASRPHIGPLSINDDSSEETFVIFDHPHVMIFSKNSDYSQSRLEEMLSND